jgi:penicillin amidase
MCFVHFSLRRGFSLVVLLAFFGGGTGFAWQRAPTGQPGITHLNGTGGPVIIVRDSAGAPHIRARTEYDGQFGLGYTHAQDPLWQMEWQRRLASGRTAEFLGANGLKADTLFRIVGLRRAAEAAWARLSGEERQPFEAYVAGVNTYLAGHTSEQLPPEFGLLGVQPEPWTPVDVLAFSRLFV